MYQCQQFFFLLRFIKIGFSLLILFLLDIFLCHRQTLIKFQLRWFLSNTTATTTINSNDNNNINSNMLLYSSSDFYRNITVNNPKRHCVFAQECERVCEWVTSYKKANLLFEFCSMRQRNTIFIHFTTWMNCSHIFMIFTVVRDFALKLVII